VNKAVLLDRDGTLIKECHYLADPERVELEARVVPALLALQQAGYLLIVVTNQAGIGRGLITHADFRAVQERLFADLRREGIAIAGAYFCPHHPTEAKGEYLQDCECRKPKPGMLTAATADHDLDPSRSFMVGDKPADVLAGQRAGMRSVLVRTGYGAAHAEQGGEGEPDFVADDLYDAAMNFILAARLGPERA
jgi:D-glycero-D-manno-heptose 1,7-bisphosphate phosphatase